DARGGEAAESPRGAAAGACASANPLPGYPRPGKTILFLGRYDEPRKGMAVLLKALPTLVDKYPDLEVLVVGRGDEDKLRREAGPVFGHLRLLGQVDDAEKASALRSADVYCAPNLGGESFGIVLVEAMAAGAAVVASELDAFRRVLRDGQAGVLVPVGDAAALAAGIDSVLGDPERSAALTDFSRTVVTEYDWPVVAEQILRVYETVTVGRDGVREVGS
ncbi:glycosyltransferase family 4 protein, partial [Rhodococcus opacus]